MYGVSVTSQGILCSRCGGRMFAEHVERNMAELVCDGCGKEVYLLHHQIDDLGHRVAALRQAAQCVVARPAVRQAVAA